MPGTSSWRSAPWAWKASDAWSSTGARRTASKQRSWSRRRSRPSSWWTMASATRAWENQNWSSVTSTTTPALTSERRASIRSASDASVTTSSASNDAARPYTASASTTCRRPCSSPASCWRTASSSDHGSSASSRSATIGRGPTTRISSSTTNGMPALRRCRASMNADDGWPPLASEIAATIAPTSVRSRRSRRTCSTAWRRSRRRTSSPPGWPRDRSFGRYVAMTTRFGHGCWAMRSMRLALAASTQWRSSTTSTTGPRPTAAATRSKTAAAVVSSAAPGPTSAATASSGRPIEPGWAVTPTVVTRDGRDSTSSRTSRVLPMPASPETRATVAWSPVTTSAASTMPASRANGRARPTITGLIPTRPLSTELNRSLGRLTLTSPTLEAAIGRIVRGWRAGPGGAPSAPGRIAAGSPEAGRSGDTLVVTGGVALLPGRGEEDDRCGLGRRPQGACRGAGGTTSGGDDRREPGSGGRRAAPRGGAWRCCRSGRGARRSPRMLSTDA